MSHHCIFLSESFKILVADLVEKPKELGFVHCCLSHSIILWLIYVRKHWLFLMSKVLIKL